MKRIISSIICLSVTLACFAQTMTSPNGKVKVTLKNDIGLSFEVKDEENVLIRDVILDFVLATEKTTIMVSKAKISGKPTVKLVSEDIVAPNYRQAKFSSKYNYATIKLNCGVNLEFKIFDDGVAYRYVTTGIKGEYKVVNEEAEFALGGDFVTYLPFTTNPKKPEAMAFQATYSVGPVTRQRNLHAFLPVTIDCKTAKVTLMESDLEAYPGMFVKADGTTLKATFAKYPKTFDYYEWQIGRAHV